MRHRVHVRKLGRTTEHRLAMYRNLLTSLLDHERIETTDVKAKEVRRLADRMITLGKRGDLHARRRAMRMIRERGVAAKLFGELADRFRERHGGYTRVVKTRRRVGDAAGMSIVELVEPLGGVPPAARGKRAAGRKKRGGEPEARAAAKPAKAAGKKAAAKRPAAKKAAAAKPAAKKAGAKKSATKKKAGAKKTTASKAGAKKSAKSKKPGGK